LTIRIDIDAEPKPHAVLFDSHGDFLIGEAIRWRARYSINLLLPGGPGRSSCLLSARWKDNRRERARDCNPRVLAFPSEHL
jgi:hypothetical protein